MQGPNPNSRRLGRGQFAFLMVLAVVTLAVVIGAGYYILRDTGVIDSRSGESPAASPTSDDDTTRETSANVTATPDDSSVDLPPAWTPTTFGVSEIDSTQWALQLSDLPVGFQEETLDQFDAPPLILSADDGATLVNKFAFAKEGDSPQFIFGITMLVPDNNSKADFDENFMMPDLFIEEFLASLEHNGILEQQEINGLENIGDASFGMSFVVDMESVEMRIEIITFRRDIAGALLVTMHIDGFSANIPIQDLANRLDQRIIPSLPAGQ